MDQKDDVQSGEHNYARMEASAMTSGSVTCGIHTLLASRRKLVYRSTSDVSTNLELCSYWQYKNTTTATIHVCMIGQYAHLTKLPYSLVTLYIEIPLTLRVSVYFESCIID